MNKSLLLSLAALPLVGTTGQTKASKIQERPNIILFLVDDMGWQDTSLPFWKEKTRTGPIPRMLPPTVKAMCWNYRTGT